MTALYGSAAVPWALGTHAVYVSSAQYTGLGLIESYQMFQEGSHVGNILWFVLWTGASVLTCWLLSHKTTVAVGAVRLTSYVLYCYGVPATLLLLPDAAMGFAVSHVRAFTDSTALHSAIVEFLITTGAAALACAALLSITSRRRRRHRPAPAPGH